MTTQRTAIERRTARIEEILLQSGVVNEEELASFKEEKKVSTEMVVLYIRQYLAGPVVANLEEEYIKTQIEILLEGAKAEVLGYQTMCEIVKTKGGEVKRDLHPAVRRFAANGLCEKDKLEIIRMVRQITDIVFRKQVVKNAAA
jgi:hypothetical protein